jgi:3,5-epimerase/4-reductase
MKILIIGNGFIGGRCAKKWDNVILFDKMIEGVADILQLLDQHKPDVVLNAAGIVGKPNVDWCETHQVETWRGNTILPLQIAEACKQHGIYMLHIGTGCIFYGEAPHGKPWKEDDLANPLAVYTRCKYAADLVLSTLDNVGIARIRMPIDSIPHPANLIDKLVAFDKVVDVENSVTVVEDMIDVFYSLLEEQAPGIFHVTNPGSIKHMEILSMYKEIVDPQHHNEWISAKDLVEQGLADKTRSNNIMQSTNLEKYNITMRPVREALRDTLTKYKNNKK